MFIVRVGCASGKISVEIWQDFLECVVSARTDDNLSTSHLQTLSSSQVCRLLHSNWPQLNYRDLNETLRSETFGFESSTRPSPSKIFLRPRQDRDIPKRRLESVSRAETWRARLHACYIR